MAFRRVFPLARSTLADRYTFDSPNTILGEGRHGFVRTCISQLNGERCACKTIPKSNLVDSIDIESLRREVKAMKELSDNCHVVRLIDVIEDSKAVHLIMEYCNGGDLYAYITGKTCSTELETMELFYEIVVAVTKCHAKGWMHRDLKPENILLQQKTNKLKNRFPSVKLADFGMATKVKSSQNGNGFVGSPPYMAPEILQEVEYGYKADIWSLGVLLFAMLSGSLPFRGTKPVEIFNSIQKRQLNMNSSKWGLISEDAKDLVFQLLNVDPDDRPTAVQILGHPWLQKLTRAKSLHREAESFGDRKRRNLENFGAYRKFESSSECSSEYGGSEFGSEFGTEAGSDGGSDFGSEFSSDARFCAGKKIESENFAGSRHKICASPESSPVCSSKNDSSLDKTFSRRKDSLTVKSNSLKTNYSKSNKTNNLKTNSSKTNRICDSGSFLRTNCSWFVSIQKVIFHRRNVNKVFEKRRIN